MSIESDAAQPDRQPSAAKQTDAAAELAQIEQRLAEAWINGDRDAIASVLAADWTVIDVAGRLLTKAEVLEEMFSAGDHPIAAMAVNEVKVRMVGEVGVVTGRTVAQGCDGTVVVLRFTDVFAKREDRWQVVASQGTPIVR